MWWPLLATATCASTSCSPPVAICPHGPQPSTVKGAERLSCSRHRERRGARAVCCLQGLRQSCAQACAASPLPLKLPPRRFAKVYLVGTLCACASTRVEPQLSRKQRRRSAPCKGSSAQANGVCRPAARRAGARSAVVVACGAVVYLPAGVCRLAQLEADCASPCGLLKCKACSVGVPAAEIACAACAAAAVFAAGRWQYGAEHCGRCVTESAACVRRFARLRRPPARRFARSGVASGTCRCHGGRGGRQPRTVCILTCSPCASAPAESVATAANFACGSIPRLRGGVASWRSVACFARGATWPSGLSHSASGGTSVQPATPCTPYPRSGAQQRPVWNADMRTMHVCRCSHNLSFRQALARRYIGVEVVGITGKSLLSEKVVRSPKLHQFL